MTDQETHETPEMTPGAIPPPPIIEQPALMPQHTVNTRPTAALVVGILLTIFAGINLINVIMGASQLLGFSSSNPYPQEVFLFSFITIVLFFFMNLTTGIGLIRFTPWARKATVVTQILMMVLTVLRNVINISSINSIEHLAPEGGAAIMRTTVIITTVAVTIISLGIGATFILLLTRPNVMQAFRQKGE